jgi:hypothetical protein
MLQDQAAVPEPEDYQQDAAAESQDAEQAPDGAEEEGEDDAWEQQQYPYDPGGPQSPFPIPLQRCIQSSLVLKANPSFTVPAVFTNEREEPVPVSVLIDTGADFSVLNSVVLRKLGLAMEDYVNTNNLDDYQCYDASGHSMKVVGVLSKPIEFQFRAESGEYETFTIEPHCRTADGFWSVTVICDKCPFPFLMGWPLLGHHGFVVNPARLCVEARGRVFVKSLQSSRVREGQPEGHGQPLEGFSAFEQRSIAPLTSALVPVWIPDLQQKWSSEAQLIFVPDETFVQTTGLVFTATAFDRSNPVVMVTNTNCHQTELPILTRLGTVQEYFCKTVHALNRRSLRNQNRKHSRQSSEAEPQAPEVTDSVPTPAPPPPTAEHSDPLPSVHASVPEQYRANFEECVAHYKDIFHNDFSKDSWDTAPAAIDLKPGAKPFHANPFRLPAAHTEAMRTIIEKFIKEGVVEPSNSPWAAPCFLVPKPGGALRFVIDYRVLNGFTTRCHWPLPNIEDLLMKLSRSRLFSVFDAHTGFHQMPLDEEARYLTSFITSFGQYMYTRLPMGLANAPSLFMRAMSDFTRDLLNIVVFVDDITVYNGAEAGNAAALYKNHLQFLRAFFAKCRAKNLKLNGKKSTVGAPEINYLGHRINADGIFPGPDKVDAVQSFHAPSTVTQVRQFLGIVNFYRQWIRDCARIQIPLNSLTRKDTTFHWTPECERAFEELKACLTKDCVRRFPDPKMRFHLETDSSDYAIGAVLSQRQPYDGAPDEGYVLSYFSRGLSGAELNYSAYEKECLAIVAAITYFRPYLATLDKFIVHTDHRSLATMLKWKDPPRRIARWLATLAEYAFETVYRPGPQNGNADALSRLPSKYVSVPGEEHMPARIICRDGNWLAEGQFDRDDAGHLTVHVAVAARRRTAPRDRRATVAPPQPAPALPPVPTDATAPPATPQAGSAPASRPAPSADELFLLYGRVFVDQETGWRFRIADVVYDAAHQCFTGLRTADPPTPESFEDEWLPIEYFLRNINAVQDTIVHRYGTEDFKFDAHFRAAVEEELPKLIRDKVLQETDVVMLPDERNQCHYFRRYLDRKSQILHLQLILPSGDVVAQSQIIKTALLRAMHDELGHQGVGKTYRRLRQVVFWKNMRHDVEQYIKSCDLCELKGKASDRAHDPRVVLRHPSVYRPFQRVSVDLIGPLPVSHKGHKHVVVMVDHFSKWVIAHPIPSKDAEQVAEALIQRLYMIFGPAEVLLADNGSEITANQVNAQVFQRLGSHLTNTVGYHPASNGQVERMNRVIKDAIAKYTEDRDHKDWDRLLPLVVHSINTSVSTTTGYTPYMLLFGRECRHSIFELMPRLDELYRPTKQQREYVENLTRRLLVMHTIAAENIDAAQSLYNKPGVYHRALYVLDGEEPLYPNGSEVLVYTPAVKENNAKKLSKFWHGPYRVVSRLNATTYLVEIGGETQPMHISRMKPFLRRPPQFKTASRPLLY